MNHAAVTLGGTETLGNGKNVVKEMVGKGAANRGRLFGLE